MLSSNLLSRGRFTTGLTSPWASGMSEINTVPESTTTGYYLRETPEEAPKLPQ